MSKINFSDFLNLSKEEKYKAILPQISSLIEGEKNLIANLANVVSALKYTFKYFLWVGFYFVDPIKKLEMVVGPYQGKVACTRLRVGKGVCGTVVEKKETILVADVNSFPGHVLCDADSKSEIVIPVIKNGEVIAVLDVDSDSLGAFDNTDKKYLEEIISKIKNIF
jgi:L-methionine (R)-S-oxide reductase